MNEQPHSWTTSELTEQRTADRVPPAGFMKKLRAKHPKLDVIWNQKRARWILVLWVPVVETTKAGLVVKSERPRVIWTVRNPDGSYRDLDDVVFNWLDAHDARDVDMDAWLREADKREAAAEAKARVDDAERAADILMDNKKLLLAARSEARDPLDHREYRSIVVDGAKDEA
ncbi:MAG: hypothetical protein AABY75_05450 [Bacteroidota bacterium]